MLSKKNLVGVTAALVLQAGPLFAADAQPNPIASFMPLILIFVIFYFFMIRPQQKKAKEMQKMIDGLKRDDKVLTSGGIYGTVSAIKGNIIELKIADGVKVQFEKSAIVSVVADTVVIPEIVKN